VTVSGAEYAPGEVIYQITTGSGGWSSSDRWLPYGSYELRQLSAPSYAGESEMADIFFAITKDGDITDIPV
jgi:hypothetical protein